MHKDVPSAVLTKLQITPSKKLVFHKCFGEFECGRLDVPMDWKAAPENQNARVAIAITKLPAKVPVTDPRYGGPILVNPGSLSLKISFCPH